MVPVERAAPRPDLHGGVLVVPRRRPAKWWALARGGGSLGLQPGVRGQQQAVRPVRRRRRRTNQNSFKTKVGKLLFEGCISRIQTAAQAVRRRLGCDGPSDGSAHSPTLPVILERTSSRSSAPAARLAPTQPPAHRGRSVRGLLCAPGAWRHPISAPAAVLRLLNMYWTVLQWALLALYWSWQPPSSSLPLYF